MNYAHNVLENATLNAGLIGANIQVYSRLMSVARNCL